MKTMMLWLLQHWMLGGMLLFAAGAPPAMDAGGADGAGDTAAGDLPAGDDTAAADDGDSADGGEAGTVDDQADDQAPVQGKPGKDEEPELQDFRNVASSRLRALTKQSPELAAALAKSPAIRDEIEARFRRDFAYREIFPTVAEARQMREHFPNGLADVQQLQSEVQELEAIDKDFYGRDRDGNYSGHGKLLQNMYDDDREATVSLLKTMPKEWARLDPASYNEVMGRIVGVTLANEGVIDYLSELAEKSADKPEVQAGIKKLLNWAQGFTREKPRPTAEQEQHERERANWARESAERAQSDAKTFHRNFESDSRKLQTDIIKAHPAIKKLYQASIAADKKDKIVEEIRARVEKFLGGSRSFMSKLNPAYKSRNLQETINVQKAAWNQAWLLNRMIREVMKTETPAMVNQNREAVRRRAGAPAARPPAQTGDKEAKHSKPYQVGKNWFWPNGQRMSIDDILRGKHEQ